MLLKRVLASLAVLFAAVNAAPVSQSDAVSAKETAPFARFVASQNSTTNSTTSINDCGDSIFYFQTSDSSPLSSDCLQIATNIAGGGSWEVETLTGKHHQLVQYGTCAFGVTVSSSDLFVYIGNQDIIDLIRESVDVFGDSGKVGARGRMRCQAGLLEEWVNWDIYHNGT
ncbi:hypothetical protein CONLIGDRAFT_634289 [Coniochaeta ligniaria NRRL 30616]|uniref:Ecp2 effector protein-like domain-containing protein n=1 Tax=Coniochaeta ligniaria NRRL 30616 TaxID=1408157 RepID=A0A1J7IKZ9_9PEZI|nr:hypothetical protein CONLIGDRAFT_634289 [Coniochaeta ligniaria NRRL 30616]